MNARQLKKDYEKKLKSIKMQLISICPIRWRVVKEELPNKQTRYAGRYGVTVLGFDLDEYVDSGSCDPCEVSFDFKKKQFLSLCTNGSWIAVGITHWTPKPPIPVLTEENNPVATSPLGFKYLKGCDKLAKAFAEMGKQNDKKKCPGP
jgi:hypothetical protein